MQYMKIKKIMRIFYQNNELDKLENLYTNQ